MDRVDLVPSGVYYQAVRHRRPRPHALETLGEAHVALDAVAPDALDAPRPAADRAGGEEVRRGRGVAFDVNLSWRDVARRRDLERVPFPARHLDAEAAHHVQ